jgi:hypothetical protein
MRANRIAAGQAALVTLLVALAGCGGTVRPTPTTGARPANQHASRTLITAADFASVNGGTSALDAIQRLRPMYLRPTPSMGAPVTRAPVVVVYVNGAFAGGVDALAMISSSMVESARYLDRSEALRFIRLMQPGDGFILVTLKNFARTP